MIPKIIHQTWKTNEVPGKWRHFVDKVKRLNPGWDYKLWSDNDNDVFVKKEFPEFYETFIGFPKPIMRADVIRYLIMYKIGGAYLDLDYEMLKPFDFADHKVVLPKNRSVLFGDKKDAIGNCIFASEPGHQFWKDVIDDLQNNPPGIKDYGEVIDATGPGLLTRIYYSHSYDDVHTPERILYHPPTPSGPKAAQKIRDNGESLGIHHPWGSWRERWTASYIKKKVRKNLRKLGFGSP